MDKNISDKVRKLNELAEDFTLSHAILATAKMIEDEKNLFNSEDENFLENFKNLEEKDLKQRIEQKSEMTLEKVYISVGNLSAESTALGARTYRYSREMLSKIDGAKPSLSEHFEIILPPKGSVPVLAYKNKKLSKECVRFLVGHELGHLWLHLDKIRDVKNFQGTISLPAELEQEANKFSFELSNLRDEHILKRAVYIIENRPDIIKR
jgi:hypothetical protein